LVLEVVEAGAAAEPGGEVTMVKVAFFSLSPTTDGDPRKDG